MARRVAILGAGNGGCAMAADLSLRGHTVNLFELPEFGSKLDPIVKGNGIELLYKDRQELARLNAVTTDVAEAINGVEFIFVTTVANGHRRVAELVAPYLKPDQLVVLIPGSSGGALEFAKVLRDQGVKDCRIAETNTLPYATRMAGPNSVRIKLMVQWFLFACFPGKYTAETLEKFREFYPVAQTAEDVLETSLNNGNPVNHSTPTLLNAGRVEYSKGEFYLYKEAITPSVSRVVEAVDNERLSLCRVLGYPEYPSTYRLFKSGYASTDRSLYEAYTTSEVFCGQWSSKGPTSLTSRYISEDVGFGMVFWTSLADMLNIQVPILRAAILLASVLNNVDYQAACTRTASKLGISGLDRDSLKKYLWEGE